MKTMLQKITDIQKYYDSDENTFLITVTPKTENQHSPSAKPASAPEVI